MKKILFMAALFSMPLAHAIDVIKIFDNPTPIGNFVPASVGLETIIPYWTKLKGTTGLTKSGTFQFNVFSFNTNTKLFSTAVKTFPYPGEVCGVDKQGNNNSNDDTFKMVKTTGTVIGYGRTLICDQYDTVGNSTGNEITYSHVYVADLATNKVWTVTSLTEQLVGFEVVPDQNGNAKQEIVMTFGGKKTAIGNPPVKVSPVRVLVVDSVTGATISNKTYVVGQPGD